MSNTEIEIKIENVEMDISSVEPAEASNTEMLKEIQAKLEKLSLSDRQKIMVFLVSSMSKDVRKASKLLEKEDAKPKRKSAHLEIHRDWAAFVLAHAQQHGWPAFEVEKVKKDKSVTTDRYSESIHKDGKFIFADSLEKPKQISSSIAAQLAKFYWRSKENVGTNKALYDEFIAKRPAKDESESASEPASASSSTTSSPKKKKLTDEEKEAKKNADKEAKDAEKLKKQMDREIAKKKKEEEERQKLQAKLDQIGKPKPKSPKKTEVPAAAIASSVAASPAVSTASPTVKRVVAKKTKEAKQEFKDDFVATDPTGVEFDDWIHTDELGNTKQYMRNALNEIAEEDEDGQNVIVGTYDPKTNKIIMD